MLDDYKSSRDAMIALSRKLRGFADRSEPTFVGVE